MIHGPAVPHPKYPCQPLDNLAIGLASWPGDVRLTTSHGRCRNVGDTGLFASHAPRHGLQDGTTKAWASALQAESAASNDADAMLSAVNAAINSSKLLAGSTNAYLSHVVAFTFASPSRYIPIFEEGH